MTQVGSVSKKCLICFIKLIPTYQLQSLVNHMRPLSVLISLLVIGKCGILLGGNKMMHPALLIGPIPPVYCLNTEMVSM